MNQNQSKTDEEEKMDPTARNRGQGTFQIIPFYSSHSLSSPPPPDESPAPSSFQLESDGRSRKNTSAVSSLEAIVRPPHVISIRYSGSGAVWIISGIIPILLRGVGITKMDESGRSGADEKSRFKICRMMLEPTAL